MSSLAAVALAAALAATKIVAPAPRPADAAAVLAEVKRPGAGAVIVNVWATWCLPCREEFPDLLRVVRDLSSQRVRLVLVSADAPEMIQEATWFLSEQGVDFQTMIQGAKDEAFINGIHPRWSGALPATFVYDGRGRLVRFWEGKASYADIKARAQEALASKEAP
jgi:thiol-disulfide isomerase/thioredoxin